MPLGSSLLITGLILYFRAGLVIFSLVAGLSLAINVYTYKCFYIDWQKQKNLISLFSHSDAIKQSDLILIDDRTVSMNALGRIYRFYEWNGMLKLAFKNERHFALNYEDYPGFLHGDYDGYFGNGVTVYSSADFIRKPNLSVLRV